MKKYLFILVAVILCTTASAQRKLYIYNFSSNDITVSDITTKHITNAYPTFIDNEPNFIIPSNSGFELSNNNIPTYRFPFFSSVDIIDRWNQATSATTHNLNISASTVTATQIIPSWEQVFHCIKFTDGSGGGLVGTTPFGSSEVVTPDTTAYYEVYSLGTLIEYTIVILDN